MGHGETELARNQRQPLHFFDAPRAPGNLSQHTNHCLPRLAEQNNKFQVKRENPSEFVEMQNIYVSWHWQCCSAVFTFFDGLETFEIYQPLNKIVQRWIEPSRHSIGSFSCMILFPSCI